MSELSYSVPAKGEALATTDGKIKTALSEIKETVNGKLNHANLEAAAEITRAQLVAEARGVRGKWYAPKVTATEQTRESTSFGTLSTEDKIEGIELSENGLIVVSFRCKAKCSVANAGRIAIFLGANQVKGPEGTAYEREVGGTNEFRQYYTASSAMGSSNTVNADVTTGQIFGASPFEIAAAAGTYTISVQYKATSGSITAKERKLLAYTLG